MLHTFQTDSFESQLNLVYSFRTLVLHNYPVHYHLLPSSCKLLSKLTLLCGVLILLLLLNIFQNIYLRFGVFILSLLYRICWKSALLYGLLFLPLFFQICKNFDLCCPCTSSPLQASSKSRSESRFPNTSFPLTSHLQTSSKTCSSTWCPYPSSSLQAL